MAAQKVVECNSSDQSTSERGQAQPLALQPSLCAAPTPILLVDRGYCGTVSHRYGSYSAIGWFCAPPTSSRLSVSDR